MSFAINNFKKSERWKKMFSFQQYVLAESVDQAYELNQKKNNIVLGGTGWLKTGRNGLLLNRFPEPRDFYSLPPRMSFLYLMITV